MKPKYELLPISEIARRCGINRATAAARLDELGYQSDESSTAKNQLFPFDDEMEFSIKAAKDSLSAAKIRDIRASSQLKELKLAEAQGHLVPYADMVDLVQRVFGGMHKELGRLPGELATRLAKAKTAVDVKRILKHAIERKMKMLRDDSDKVLN